MKRVTIGAKPPSAKSPASADAWVANKPTPGEAAEPIKRLTIDIPLSLHRRVRTESAREGVTIADAVRDFLDKRFPGREHDHPGVRKGGRS